MVHVCTFDHPPKFPVVSKTTIWRFADSAGTRNQFFHSTHDFSLLFSKIWQYKLIVYFIPFIGSQIEFAAPVQMHNERSSMQ